MSDKIHVPSSSSIILVTAWWVVPKDTKLDGLIIKLKVSKASNVSLSNIDMLNDLIISPAENKILYGPGS